MSKYLITFLICLNFALLPKLANTQINIKVGYNLGYMDAPTLNQLVNDFNTDPSYVDIIQIPMSEFHTISGIEIGGRYSFNNSSVELTYDNLNKDHDAVGEQDNGSLFEEQLFYSQKGVNLSLETKFGVLGWGAGIARRTQQLRGNVATSNNKYVITKQSDFALKLFLVFDFGGTDNLSFELRPFFIYPLNESNLSQLAGPDEWNITPSAGTSERFTTFGLSFAFYNGPQL